jgi:hypothetical protein
VLRAAVSTSHVGGADVDHLAASGAERGQIRRLVLLALAAQQVGGVVGSMRALAVTARDLALERGQVLARDVVVEVGGREGQAEFQDLHRRLYRKADIPLMPSPACNAAMMYAFDSMPDLTYRAVG